MFVRFQPFSIEPVAGPSVADLARTIDGLFENVLVTAPSRFGREYPALEVVETKDATVVSAEIPGLTKEDLKISLHDGVLTISGKRKPAAAPEDTKTLRKETWRGDFSRSIVLSHEVKTDQLRAELSNGILTITLPKAEQARPREITIQ